MSSAPPSSSPSSPTPLRIGYVPEHYSTPLHFSLSSHPSVAHHNKLPFPPSFPTKLIPFPSGTGHMITALRAGELDVAIGLTEAWVAGLGKAGEEGKDLGKGEGGYRLVGGFVESRLCWAVSGARGREGGVKGLKGGKLGVSRVGSGSYIMGFVLADQQGWIPSPTPSSTADDRNSPPPSPFSAILPLQTFSALISATSAHEIDFFLWESFTTKPHHDNGTLARVGEIYTPWPSWHIVATPEVINHRSAQLEEFFERLNGGVEYFNAHPAEAVEFITGEMEYSREDAEEWMKRVEFAGDVRGVKEGVVEDVVRVLRKAGVLSVDGDVGGMVAFEREG